MGNMLTKATSKRKLEQLVIAKGNFKGELHKEKRTVESISNELMELFNLDEEEMKKRNESKQAQLRDPFENGVLKEGTLDRLLDRESTEPYEDGPDRGFQMVKKNSSFTDLF